MVEKNQEKNFNFLNVNIFKMLKKIKKQIKKICYYKVLLGHKSSERNPKMLKYILYKKNNYDILNPFFIIKYISKAQFFLEKCAYNGGSILFVGTKKQNKKIIEKYAKKVDMPYINYKWPAGLLTNMKNTILSIKNKKKLKIQKKTIYKFLSKKEKLLIDRKYKKIKKKYGTIYNMYNLPMVIIIIDVKKENLALKEAYKKSIFSIGIVDSDSKPDFLDCIIPANDDLSISVNFILKNLTKAILKGLKKRKIKLFKQNEQNRIKENIKIKKIN